MKRYPLAGDLQKKTQATLTANPTQNPVYVYSEDGGLEGTFAREDDAEGYADELRGAGARNVRVEKKPRTRVLRQTARQNPRKSFWELPNGARFADDPDAHVASWEKVDDMHARALVQRGHVSVATGKLIRIDPDLEVFLRESVRPWDGASDPITNPYPQEEDCDTDILDGMARAIWVTSYADWVESMSRDERKAAGLPASTSGIDWDKRAPATPDSAVDAARDLYLLIERANGKSPGALFAQACFVDGCAQDSANANLFGHYLTMQAIGAGASWFDDHKEFRLLTPRGFEAHYDDGQVWWSPQVRSRMNPGGRS